MKKVVLVLFLVMTFPALACPVFSGKFQCPKEASEHGPEQFEVDFVAAIRTFIIKTDEGTSAYQLDVWTTNQAPRKRIFHGGQLFKAECFDDTVNLMFQDDVDGEIYSSSFTPKVGGVLVEFEERYEDGSSEIISFFCKKI